MKLSGHFRHYTFYTLLAVMVIGSLGHYFIFRWSVHRSTDEVLYEYKQRVTDYVLRNDTLIASSQSVLKPQRVMEQTLPVGTFYPETIRDTSMYNETAGEFMPYRQLFFTVTYKGEPHLVTISQPTIDDSDLFFAVLYSLILLLILFVLFFYITNRVIQERLWRPFYKTLQKLRGYNFLKADSLQLDRSNVDEFNELNEVAQRMVEKIRADYVNLKTFTEDVSHEMQTPLSIIKSKFDLLIQTPVLTEETILAISSINAAVTRLSKMNKALLMLAKINNNQFQETVEVSISKLIDDYLVTFAEWIEGRGLRVERRLNEQLNFTIHPVMADVLVSNLLSNAIRHTPEGGHVVVDVSAKDFTISNTCTAETVDSGLFSRFRKKHHSENSTGLGLPIVKSIVDKNGLFIEYRLREGMFTIRCSKP